MKCLFLQNVVNEEKCFMLVQFWLSFYHFYDFSQSSPNVKLVINWIKTLSYLLYVLKDIAVWNISNNWKYDNWHA
jgi:hypothetical protein